MITVKHIRSLIIMFVMMMGFNACKNDSDTANPYVNNNEAVTDTTTPPSPTSIAGLHKKIFSVRCANPGCHDGTFEPDFRTVQSTWTTLVYNEVNKTTLDSVSFFNVRVMPNDVSRSFLIERLTTTTSDYMPSNGSRLTAADIELIKTWINNGAPDPYGRIPVKPNLAPNVAGFIAVDGSFIRLDTNRVNDIVFNPFLVPGNSMFYLPFLALDTADGSGATDPADFTQAFIKISTSADDYTSAQTITCTWQSPIPYPAWQAVIPTTGYASGDVRYFRIYVNDGFQPFPAEFPRTASPSYYKSYYSFQVQ